MLPAWGAVQCSVPTCCTYKVKADEDDKVDRRQKRLMSLPMLLEHLMNTPQNHSYAHKHTKSALSVKKLRSSRRDSGRCWERCSGRAHLSVLAVHVGYMIGLNLFSSSSPKTHFHHTRCATGITVKTRQALVAAWAGKGAFLRVCLPVIAERPK
ncbi:hypothetical protein IG631_19636 [Alternaria alternata]|nr:hypothetical protein IG631_19636 [Alternaria alternata]